MVSEIMMENSAMCFYYKVSNKLARKMSHGVWILQ